MPPHESHHVIKKTAATSAPPPGNLLDAVRNGDAVSLRACLRDGANIDERDGNGSTALMLAILKGDEAVAKTLINKGADVNACDNGGATPLMYAANGYPDTLKRLHQKGAQLDTQDNFGMTALMIAMQVGDADCATFIVESNANVSLRDHDGRTAADWARLNNHEDLASLIELQPVPFPDASPTVVTMDTESTRHAAVAGKQRQLKHTARSFKLEKHRP